MVRPTRKNLRAIDSTDAEDAIRTKHIRREVDSSLAKHTPSAQQSGGGGEKKAKASASAAEYSIQEDRQGDPSAVRKSVKKYLEFSKCSKSLPDESHIRTILRYEKNLGSRLRSKELTTKRSSKLSNPFDLWGSSIAVPPPPAPPSLEDSLLSPDLSDLKKSPFNTLTMCSRVTPTTVDLQQGPAVKQPHPGTSMNPPVESQMDALTSTVTADLDKEVDEETHIANREPMMTTLRGKVSPELLAELTEEEKQTALFFVHANREVTRESLDAHNSRPLATGGSSASTEETSRPPVEVWYRTKAERNRRKRYLQLVKQTMEQKRQLAMERTFRIGNFERLLKENKKNLRKSLARKEYKESQRKEEHEAIKRGDVTQVTMAQCTFKEKQFDVNTFEETSRGLRTLKVARHGAPVFDRYDSFFRRALLVDDHRKKQAVQKLKTDPRPRRTRRMAIKELTKK